MKERAPGDDDIDFDPEARAATALDLHVDDVNGCARSCFEGRAFAEEFDRLFGEMAKSDTSLLKTSERREMARENLLKKLIERLKVWIEADGKPKTANRRRLKKS